MKFVCGMLFALLLVCASTSPFEFQPVRATGTICIRADGSVDPPTAPIQRNGDVYTLTNNITTDTGGILIERNNMTLDGAGHSIQGTENVTAIYVSGRTNVTIRKTGIVACSCGIFLYMSSGNSMTGNNIKQNKVGVELWNSSFNGIYSNTIEQNTLRGIELYDYSNSNNIVGNNLTSNGGDGVFVFGQSSGNVMKENVFSNDGLYISNSQGNFVEGNIVNRKPLVYLEGASNRTVGDAGQVILVNCENILVDNLNLSDTAVGVELLGTKNSKIANNIIANNPSGIYLEDASDNVVNGNSVTANKWHGIELYMSSYNNVSENTVVANGEFLNGDGFSIYFSSGNIVSGNNITANKWHGLEIYESSENIVSGNNLTANGDIGIYLYSSSSNRIDGNYITSNPVGICFNGECMYNSIYHNNFDQAFQVEFMGLNLRQTNLWDDGYPSGGNYWSDYAGVDELWGRNQDLKGCDMIGDTAYVIDAFTKDQYPLMTPWRLSRPATTEFPDINGDGVVNIVDIAIVAKNFGKKFQNP